MILEPSFLQEAQKLYERSVRLKRLQHSYTNRMDTFVCNYITRHDLWSNPGAVGVIMNCLPSLYYPEMISRIREVFHCEKYELLDLAYKENYPIDQELKRRLLKIFPVLRDRKEKAGKATEALWQYIYNYIEEKQLLTNKEALEKILHAVPDGYVRFRILDSYQLEMKKEQQKNKKKEECR